MVEPPGHPAQKLKKPTRSPQLGDKYDPGGHVQAPNARRNTALAPWVYPSRGVRRAHTCRRAESSAGPRKIPSRTPKVPFGAQIS